MKIKKYIISLVAALAVCLPLSVVAQHFIGIRGGAGAGSIRLVPAEETELNFATPFAGIAYRYYGGDKYFGGIEVNLNLQQKGFKVLPRPESDSSYVREITQIELPFLWQPHVPMFKDRARLFFNAGPYVAYNLSSNEKFVSKTTGTLNDENGNLWDYEYEFDSQRDNRLEYGLAFGGGYAITVKERIDIQLEFRYNFGLSDLLKNSNKYPGNPYNSPLDFLGVSFGVYYRLE